MQIRRKNSHKALTLILVPGKYGRSKTLSIYPWLIPFISSVIVFSAILSVLLLYRYVKVLEKQSSYKENIEYQSVTIESQQKELDKLKSQEKELQDRLEEMKNLEELLKKKANISTKEADISKTNGNMSLIESVDFEITKVYGLFDKVDKVAEANSRIPHLLPCQGLITSYFGGRLSPTSRGVSENHTGIDIAASYKTPVHAAANGIVEYSGWLPRYGNTIIINHQNGYSTLYGHNAKLLAAKGTKVKSGQTISLMGSTGRSTGTHVHFEIRLNDKAINPLKFIRGGK